VNDLLVSYPWGRFYPARREALHALKALGDSDATMGWTFVMGIAVAHTTLDNRQVIHQCRELFHQGKVRFDFAVKWVPVDYWCWTELETIKQLIDEKVLPRIGQEETWAMQVNKRRWQTYHTIDIVTVLAADIDRKVNLSHPDKIVWIDVIGNETAISVLKPDEIFSVICE
jgi:tRNA acetyltransferase TAN1